MTIKYGIAELFVRIEEEVRRQKLARHVGVIQVLLSQPFVAAVQQLVIWSICNVWGLNPHPWCLFLSIVLHAQ